MYRIDATIDDLDPRLWPDVLDGLHAAGAADVWCAPVLMRKGRPGHVLSALAAADVLDAVCQAIFRQTTTLGVRVSPVQRRSLHRDQIAVSVGGAEVTHSAAFSVGRSLPPSPSTRTSGPLPA